jgi:hypothetical protein
MTTTTCSAPERSLAQCLSALDRANDIRIWRAERKRDIKAGRLTSIELLVACPEPLASMKVIDLLLATPKIGRVKANQMLYKCVISPSKTVGGLSPRQRAALAALIGSR